MNPRRPTSKKFPPRSLSALTAVVVNDACLGIIDDLPAGLMTATTEIGVFKVEKETLVKAAESFINFRAHKVERSKQPINLFDVIVIKVSHEETIQISVSAAGGAEEGATIERRH